MPSISRLFGVGEPKSVWGSTRSDVSDVSGAGAADVNCAGVDALVAELLMVSVVSGGINVDLCEDISGALRVEDCDG